jgi:cytochrome c biogenesis protein CcdA/thiol-disulfide isomerase/thioredoxin
MIILIAFAFLAGVVTVLSPCILPVLPVVLSGTVGGGKARPLGIITGFVVSFTVFTLTLSALVSLLGISADVLRYVAAGLILAFGLVMVIPPLKNAFMRLVSGLSGAGTREPAAAGGKKGYLSGLVLGLSLGLVWTPCVGPIMASVITLALSSTVDAGAIFITLSFALGTSLPLFLIMWGGRGLLHRFPFFTKHSGAIQKVFGGLMILTAVALFTGAERLFQTLILQAFPGYGAGLTSLENQGVVLDAIAQRNAGNAPLSAGDARIQSPLLTTLAMGGSWVNSPPLTPADLEGKVVLIDFWTYSCINCIRTFPNLKTWDEHYRDKGLVIIGVHSPEFAFEQDLGNLQRAVADYGLRYPVVQDNDFKIWNSFHNHYWPAHYIFDRMGVLKYQHFGEGEYEKTEGVIQLLLGLDKNTPIVGQDQPPPPLAHPLTAETYLGYQRAQRFAGSEVPVRDKALTYSLPNTLLSGEWALSGVWVQEAQNVRAQGPGALELSFYAGHVYVVLGPVPGTLPPTLTVMVNGRPTDTSDVHNGKLKLGEYRLYELLSGDVPLEGTIRIKTDGPVRAYAFTFG